MAATPGDSNLFIITEVPSGLENTHRVAVGSFTLLHFLIAEPRRQPQTRPIMAATPNDLFSDTFPSLLPA
jgi:hypothetical protein